MREIYRCKSKAVRCKFKENDESGLIRCGKPDATDSYGHACPFRHKLKIEEEE